MRMTSRPGAAAAWALAQACAFVAGCVASSPTPEVVAAPRAEPRIEPVPAPAPASTEAFRAQRPAPEPPRAAPPEDIADTTLANGMRLVVVRRRGPSIVAADLVIAGGLGGFAGSSPATFELLAAMLLRGTSKQNEGAIFRQLDAQFGRLEVITDADAMTYRLRSAASRFDETLALLHDVVLDPAWTERTVRMMARRLGDSASRSLDDPSAVAGRAILAALLGPKHPVADRPIDASEASRDDLMALAARNSIPTRRP
jgi:zinc protease